MSGKPIWSWRHAIEESDLPSGCRHVLMTIANDLSDTGKFTRMPISEICRRTGLSLRTVETHIRTAKKHRFLGVRIRTDANGFRLGSDLSPMFPPEFVLATDTAEIQTAKVADRQSIEDSQTANSASQTANSASQTATVAGYIETFPIPSLELSLVKAKANALADGGGIERGMEEEASSLQKPEKASRKRNAYDESLNAFFASYRKEANGMQGSKSEAASEWKKLSDDDRASALAAIPKYARQVAAKNLSMKHAVRYLKHRVFDDFAPDQTQASLNAADEDAKKVQWLAMDIVDGEINASKRWFGSFGDVPRECMARARQYAAETFGFSGEGAYA